MLPVITALTRDPAALHVPAL